MDGTTRRVPEFDALRGIAAVGVVVYHYSYPGPWYHRLFYVGGSSLELFFVLSGYLITGIILQHQSGRSFFLTFYARRALRIWPIYYLSLFAIAAAAWMKPGLFPMDGFWNHLTYTQNIQFYRFREPPLFAYPLHHTWSLAVEEQFYLIWPLLVIVAGRKRLVPLALACIGCGVAARVCGFSPRILLARCDGFALGALLAVLLDAKAHSKHPTASLSRLFTITSCAALLALTLGMWILGESPFNIEGPFSSLSILATAVLFFGLIGLVSLNAGQLALRPLRSEWLCDLGRISYGVYLYHLPMMIFAERAAARLGYHSQLGIRALGVFTTILLAALSWVLIEQPCLRLKDRIGYQERPTRGARVNSRAGRDVGRSRSGSPQGITKHV